MTAFARHLAESSTTGRLRVFPELARDQPVASSGSNVQRPSQNSGEELRALFPSSGYSALARSAELDQQVEHLVQTAADGRRAGKALSAWTRRFHVSEAEFQLLWLLRTSAQVGRTQTTLARELAFSPAQVSVVVERMRERGWIFQHRAAGDRRQHLWCLSLSGRSLLEEMLSHTDELKFEPSSVATKGDHDQQEAAA